MPGEEGEGSGLRHIVLRKRGGQLQFVNQLDPRYDPLHFVLLFIYGHQGWSLRLKQSTGATMAEFYCYHIMVRDEAQALRLSD
jgi:hypothetical protein